jgi:hypothetical protein
MFNKSMPLLNFFREFFDYSTIPPHIKPTFLGNFVFDDLAANGTTSSTTSLMKYGTNIFTTVDAGSVATKLPQPVTGKEATVVNNGSVGLYVFPSNTGGTINSLGENNPIIIPPDGVAYTFKCIENPLPGAWIVSAPAITELNILEMTVSHTNGVANNGCGVGVYVSSSIGAALDGSQNIILTPNSTYWLTLLSNRFATKLKVYTNILPADMVALSPIQVWRSQAYKTAAGTVTSGQRDTVVFLTTGVTPEGQAVSPGPAYVGNVGDAGTLYGSDDTYYEALPGNNLTKIGTGTFSNFYTTFGIQIPANAATKDYKFKIFLEGY